MIKKTRNRKRLEELVAFRCFSDIRKRLLSVITHAKDDEGCSKFDDESHGIRTGIMLLLEKEERHIIIKPGRPSK